MAHETINAWNNWANTAATIITERLRCALATTPRASLVVPGGRSAQAILPSLGQAKLPWGRVDIVLADERWVDANHPDSNERLVREAFHNHDAEQATLIGLKTDALHPRQALHAIDKRLSHASRPFTVVLLGMGEDGHIASIFPHQEIPTSELCVMAAERPDRPRISLTPSALLNSQSIVLVAPGIEKLNTLNLAVSEGSALQYPVRYLLHQDRVPLTIITQ